MATAFHTPGSALPIGPVLTLPTRSKSELQGVSLQYGTDWREKWGWGCCVGFSGRGILKGTYLQPLLHACPFATPNPPVTPGWATLGTIKRPLRGRPHKGAVTDKTRRLVSQPHNGTCCVLEQEVSCFDDEICCFSSVSFQSGCSCFVRF